VVDEVHRYENQPEGHQRGTGQLEAEAPGGTGSRRAADHGDEQFKALVSGELFLIENSVILVPRTNSITK